MDQLPGASEQQTKCRDVKEEEETTPWAEQQNWESEQIRKASMRVGSKDKAKKEYDLVFEDQIDFIMDKVEVGDIEVCDHCNDMFNFKNIEVYGGCKRLTHIQISVRADSTHHRSRLENVTGF